MRIASLAACVILLVGCGSDPAPALQERIADPEARGDVLPVMGLEREIAVYANGILDGTGLAQDETYAVRLENALRARGINARVKEVQSLAQTKARPVELLVIPDMKTAGALTGKAVRILAPRMAVPAALLQGDGVHPDARGVEELVAQSADQIAAELPLKRL